MNKAFLDGGIYRFVKNKSLVLEKICLIITEKKEEMVPFLA